MQTSVRLLGASCALAFATLLSMPRSASAGLQYDLRLRSNGGKTAVVNPGDALFVDVFAVITGSNGTATDDGFTSGYFSVLSNNNLAGNTIGPSINFGGNIAPFNSGSQSGLPQDIDGDGDNDAGKKAGDPDGNARFVFPHTATAGGELGTGTGSAEFWISTFQVLITPGAGTNPATLNVVLPGNSGTGTVSGDNPITYRQDGATVTDLANVTIGMPITFIPEPASLSLLAIGALSLMRRTRRA